MVRYVVGISSILENLQQIENFKQSQVILLSRNSDVSQEQVLLAAKVLHNAFSHLSYLN